MTSFHRSVVVGCFVSEFGNWMDLVEWDVETVVSRSIPLQSVPPLLGNRKTLVRWGWPEVELVLMVFIHTVGTGKYDFLVRRTGVPIPSRLWRHPSRPCRLKTKKWGWGTELTSFEEPRPYYFHWNFSSSGWGSAGCQGKHLRDPQKNNKYGGYSKEERILYSYHVEKKKRLGRTHSSNERLSYLISSRSFTGE